ncbi:hypothetical protein HK104_009554 [Borealophlyctis nickersoniae]|nr:hypothetical protein HK104_009554 [Borealophlyctis nickersoniae]
MPTVPSPLQYLPNELLVEVLKHATHRFLLTRARLVSKTWAALITFDVQLNLLFCKHPGFDATTGPAHRLDFLFRPPGEPLEYALGRIVMDETGRLSAMCARTDSELSSHMQPLVGIAQCVGNWMERKLGLRPGGIRFVPGIFETNCFGKHLSYTEAAQLFGCKEVVLENPPDDALQYCPQPTHSLALVHLHAPVNLDALSSITHFRRLSTLRFESDGAISGQSGNIRTITLIPLRFVSPTLTHLELEGPWLDRIVSDPLGLVHILADLTSLQHLTADFDQRSIGVKPLVHLIQSLPNLVSLGRLGSVDSKFWRSWSKGAGGRLRRMAFGKRVYGLNLHSGMPGLIKDMPIGVMFWAPAVEVLEIWMGYQELMDELLIAVKRLCEGGLAPDPDTPPPPRKLRRVDIYEAPPFGTVSSPHGWKYVGVGRGLKAPPVQIRISTGTSFQGGPGRSVWIF